MHLITELHIMQGLAQHPLSILSLALLHKPFDNGHSVNSTTFNCGGHKTVFFEGYTSPPSKEVFLLCKHEHSALLCDYISNRQLLG